ncbi:MAG: DUF4129 domain-containing protein [Gaiella sp.]
MNGNAPVRSGVRGWPAAAVAVALVAGVAVASSGSIPSGSGAARRPSETLLDTVVSLAVAGTALGMVVAVAVFVLLRREVAATEAPARRNGRATAIALLWFGGLLLGVALLLRSDGSGSDRGGVFGALGRRRTDTPPGGGYEPEFQPWPVLVVGLLAAAGGLALWASHRARRRALGSHNDLGPALVLAEVLDETVDDLRDEPDPRRAVIRAYARMERGFAGAGVPRHDAEAPEEYVDRALAEVASSSRSAARLMALFSWARFSGHDVDASMKAEAIETLEQVRDELRALDAARHAAETERLRNLRGAHS